MTICLAVDVMGGDYGAEVTVPASMKALERNLDLKIFFFGEDAAITRFSSLAEFSGLADRFEIVPSSETISMDELPLSALRNKKQSSMRLAIDSVKNESTDACVSAGNTGALVAIAKYVLKTIEGVDRPAICSQMPPIDYPRYALDLGANLEASPKMLMQFALMGSALVEVLHNVDRPKVGLMNVGSEEMKGALKVKEAHDALLKTDLNYMGYVEGDAFFQGECNVIVMNGFEGNIALKASESVSRMIKNDMKIEFNKNLWTRFLGLITYKSVLKPLSYKLSPSKYNGASLLGLRGVVVKSHGSANQEGFLHAIEVAYDQVRNNIIDRMSHVIPQATC